ncbi:uncharacterized protein BDR25DRAFT_300254 [Lindgomyces ingoldianus]|uniref:Uncharacterized protein n=1 Tax=Lindgomyces ingoldianus TaxID=673940 RepID=A0ACB6RDP8_9PLEO|nr:uncharacterized protein BDR25DRAFT_300254 [Lindgomyces ingoldianus]KAF2477266.1 hypothetical protein BDR25DRAFT_300254 [Lindgomyces ingoldianus]
MSSENKPSSLPATLFTFLALYLTTLFSLDTWSAARGSPFSLSPSASTYFRPGNPRPSADSYQGQYHASGRRDGGVGGGSRGVGRLANARDSRPPMPLVGTASCGACMG